MSLQGKAENADAVGLASINLVPFTNSHVPAYLDRGVRKKEEALGLKGGEFDHWK